VTAHIEDLTGVTIAGRYVIEKCIGQGGMGRVYRARHASLSRHFAIKVLFDTVATDEKARKRFDQEAEAASRLEHPNLVPVIDRGEWDSRLFLVMEYVEGGNLADVIYNEAPLAPERVVGLARQLAAGLQHAHERGLIHRDFKPANILVMREGNEERPRILDFGLAILTDTDNHRLTTNGLVLGTPAFMSPEQACGEPIDHRSDLFALGLIMYEMLAGKHPFDGTAAAIARQNLAATPPPIRKRTPEARVPPALEAVIFRLMEKEPSDRYQSAAEVVDSLDQLYMPPNVRASSQSLSLPQMPVPPALRRPIWPRVAAAAGLAALLLAGGVWWYARDGQPDATADMNGPATLVAPATITAPPPDAAVAAPADEPPSAAAVPDKPAAERTTARRPRRIVKKPARPAKADTMAAADVSLEEFRERYRAVGALVDRLERKRGSATARPLRERYLNIPYFDALRVDSLRRDAYRKLSDISRDVRRALNR
jgi:predicted Ser/Thr protein kinase